MKKLSYPKYTKRGSVDQLKRYGVPGLPKPYTQKKPNNKNPFQPKKSPQ